MIRRRKRPAEINPKNVALEGEWACSVLRKVPRRFRKSEGERRQTKGFGLCEAITGIKVDQAFENLMNELRAQELVEWSKLGDDDFYNHYIFLTGLGEKLLNNISQDPNAKRYFIASMVIFCYQKKLTEGYLKRSLDKLESFKSESAEKTFSRLKFYCAIETVPVHGNNGSGFCLTIKNCALCILTNSV